MPTPRKNSRTPETPTRQSRRLQHKPPESPIVQTNSTPIKTSSTPPHEVPSTPTKNTLPVKDVQVIEGTPAVQTHSSPTKNKDVIEDRFFKLKEMENFLDEQDRNPNLSLTLLNEFDDDVGDADYRYEEFFGESSAPIKSQSSTEKSLKSMDTDDEVEILSEGIEIPETPGANDREVDQPPPKRIRFSFDAEEQKEIEKDLKTVEDANDKIHEETSPKDETMKKIEVSPLKKRESNDHQVHFFDEDLDDGLQTAVELEELDEPEDEKLDDNVEDIEDKGLEEDEEPIDGMAEEDEAMECEEIVNEENEAPTTFVQQQKNLREKIAELERENMEPRSWELAGEVAAQDREPDTLLSQYLDVDYRAVQPPVITEDVNARIEAIVKQRIKDKNFDDVIRVRRVDESLQTYRARTNIDEIERKSLMEMYEKQFVEKSKAMKQQIADDDEVEKLDPASEAIQKEMMTIFDKLDQLSHANYRPLEINAEPEVIVNELVVNLEEVGQKASTAPDEEMLAPEEIAKHVKSAPKSTEERNQTDKKRERRKKKKKQKVLVQRGVKKEGEYKAEAELEARKPSKHIRKKKPLANGMSLKLDKNVDFYAQLQATNEKEAIEKTTKTKRKKAERSVNAKSGAQFKL
ncbi:U3 small nucleolar ribonucleoprotein MPP10 [Aphelenchoides besseyi]|nr:U3 small nucleolar ribonucleoprotein MPP10 [Aphelenchoides besseyi]KAI6202488.1 U3 small nucleolar ribonucleoprotein MPP10 [Aphelenchoides besseyi]